MTPAGYLFDTNLVSETRRQHPDPGVIAFLVEVRRTKARAYISVLTLGELRKGVAALRSRDVAASESLARWVDETEADFSQCMIPVDEAAARLWGELLAGRSFPVIDALIAATAMVHNLALVTRNVRDMAPTGVEIVNPWARS